MKEIKSIPRSIAVKKSTIGKGIFVQKKFNAGQILFQIQGRVMHHTESEKIGGTFTDNTYRFGSETYLSPQGYVGDYLNHSCEPNAGIIKIKNKLYLKSIQTISSSQEITIDYSTILGNDDIWTMRCKCGHAACRKIISKFGKLPSHIQQKYITLGVVPRYILLSSGD